ncbi:hypothetical protein ACLGIH_08750 [Streptomyces sp. HMX87]|uniref:hypothetical protein n=1 Tax=Streptomyces sp. HMX87 TaxID=3390849 RepID=UPI003A844BCC
MKNAPEGKRKLHRSPLAIVATAIVALAVGGSAFFLSQDEAPDPGEDLCWSLVSPEQSPESGPLEECGDKLETSMTGRSAGQAAPQQAHRHSPEQVRITERVITTYAESEAAAIPEEIRQNLANALTHYSYDVFDILGIDVDFSDPDFSTTPNNLDVSAEILREFLLKLASDPGAFSAVYSSQHERIVQRIGTLTRADFTSTPTGTTDKAVGVMRESGRATGILFSIASETSPGDTEYGWPRLRNAIANQAEEVGVHEGRRLQNLFREAEKSFNDWS